jgi:hypothetical protein
MKRKGPPQSPPLAPPRPLLSRRHLLEKPPPTGNPCKWKDGGGGACATGFQGCNHLFSAVYARDPRQMEQVVTRRLRSMLGRSRSGVSAPGSRQSSPVGRCGIHDQRAEWFWRHVATDPSSSLLFGPVVMAQLLPLTISSLIGNSLYTNLESSWFWFTAWSTLMLIMETFVCV